jgi:phosphonate transport system permease protein
MATADRSLPKSGTGTGTPELGRTTIKPPKPFFLRSWFALAIFATLVGAHVYGWQEAEINPGLLVQKAPDMQRFMGEVLKPDVFTTDKKEVQMRTSVGGSATIVQNALPIEASETLIPTLTQGAQVQDNPGETESFTAKLTVSSDTVAPGQEVTLSGSGFRPNTTGKILWQSTGASASIQNIGSFTTDANGSFSTPVKVPEDAERVVNASGFPNTLAVSQQWDVGGLKLSDTVGIVVEKVIETIFLALMGTTFAVVLSIPLSFLASRNLMSHNLISKVVYMIARTILNILRSIEVLILAVIFGATIGFGPFAGVLALTLHSIASLGKLYSEAIESIDAGPIEAITATGANRLQVIMYAVVPQFIPQFLSFTLYRWDINVRMSTVIGFVGGGGIGYIVGQYISLLQWNQAATAIWAIAIVVIIMDYVSSKIRQAVI